MNERIQKLAEQAEQYADDTVNSDPAKYDKPGQVKVWRELMQAKFAELIVKECAKSIEKTIEVNCDTEDEKMGCEFAITDLLEHFGVKE